MRRLALFALFVVPVLAIAGPSESSVKVSFIRFTEDDKQVTQISARMGSGTVVEYKGGWSYVLTCRHVVPNDNGYISVFSGRKCIQGHFVAADGTADLSLIRVKHQLPTVPVADRPPDSGTEVKQYGYPGGGPQDPKAGAIVGNDQSDGKGYTPNHVQITVKPGDSGSGVFVGGKLTGVVYAGKYDEALKVWHGPANSVRLSDIQRFMKDPTANPPKEEPAKKAATPAPAVCPPGQP